MCGGPDELTGGGLFQGLEDETGLSLLNITELIKGKPHTHTHTHTLTAAIIGQITDQSFFETVQNSELCCRYSSIINYP